VPDCAQSDGHSGEELEQALQGIEAGGSAVACLDLWPQLFVVADEDELLGVAGQGGQHVSLQHLSSLLANHNLRGAGQV
jgi:hypothetical protein